MDHDRARRDRPKRSNPSAGARPKDDRVRRPAGQRLDELSSVEAFRLVALEIAGEKCALTPSGPPASGITRDAR